MHANVADEKLEERVFDIFGCLGIEEEGADIKDCHRLGYASNKNTIIRFVNRKFFYQALGKKFELCCVLTQLKNSILVKISFHTISYSSCSVES